MVCQNSANIFNLPQSSDSELFQSMAKVAPCENGGLCLQRYNEYSNRTFSNFICVCPPCFYGRLCQYALRRDTNSFEWLAEQNDDGTFDSQHLTIFQHDGITWFRLDLYLIIPSLLYLYAALNNILTFLTFLLRPKTRRAGTVASWLSMCISIERAVCVCTFSSMCLLYVVPSRIFRHELMSLSLMSFIPKRFKRTKSRPSGTTTFRQSQITAL
ncbi:unnamed protein product [Didymodactylos carnosus]|uniref:EGF-like domain-containing protein n=3 Tax=Didymodactylos carnosus TaxID=1234261 RepID=A0A8S2EUA0_9BILA|nr:unnamed protein product [Didymodactylos carnosus]CAF4109573.1 unnamed protein product [Didymodactylos carnosus]